MGIIYTKYLESRAVLVLAISEAYLSRNLKEIGWNLTPKHRWTLVRFCSSSCSCSLPLPYSLNLTESFSFNSNYFIFPLFILLWFLVGMVVSSMFHFSLCKRIRILHKLECLEGFIFLHFFHPYHLSFWLVLLQYSDKQKYMRSSAIPSADRSLRLRIVSGNSERLIPSLASIKEVSVWFLLLSWSICVFNLRFDRTWTL